jgi:cytochrome b pre-mRNA-processing protein 3
MLGTARRKRREAAEALYAKVVAAARMPVLYSGYGVPDTPTGRFEMIALHAFIVVRRLKAQGQGDLAQAVFDTFFDDMDRNLREMGVGDLGVGRRVKAMAQQFYGRALFYERGLAGGNLEEALARNIFNGQASPGSAALARYLHAADGSVADVTAFPNPQGFAP